MIPLWALLPGIQAAATRCAARPGVRNGRTLLGVKGSLRRGPPRRALDACAPFCSETDLRRAAPPGTSGSPDSSSYQDEKQMEVDKTS
jgi:hypothetical protein